MSYRFITKSIHAYVIDYPFATVLIAAPFVLKLGQSEPVAMWLSTESHIANRSQCGFRLLSVSPRCSCPP